MKGLIYKIYYKDIIYIGSTTIPLMTRFKNHKYHTTSLKPYFLKYGYDNFEIELIKEYDVVDKHQLLAYEQLYINNRKCINKNQTVDWLCSGGSRVCEHGKQKHRCIDCGGSGVCHHEKRIDACKICSPVICEICGKTYSKKTIERHRKTHETSE